MLLENIKSPEDIKDFSQKQIDQLAEECRKTIIDVVGKNGGHLASNLGVVELTIALHRVFNNPKDAIIWDVSHQCYTHKLLTGRYKQFSTLRQKDGISGFTNTAESPYDYFINGHSSTSISSALGLLIARNIKGEEGKVIAVIGDGALTGGMAFEALSQAGQVPKNLIVVLNDNQMSIDHNTGAISRYLSRLSTTSHYQTFKRFVAKGIDRIPYLGKFLEKLIFRLKRALKGLILSNNLFVDLGFEYTGPIDGHNEKALEKAFRRVSKLHRPVVVHIVTKKGRGYIPAEDKPELFHGIGPFHVQNGSVDSVPLKTFTEAFGNIIVEEAKKDNRICAITAAMAKGTGLTEFSKEFPDRFFDVGIAEPHAVTFAGGLSKGGLLPVVCIYSTFIQRSIDQIFHDVSLQKLPVILMLDRAGAVPNDGVTHQGIFDIALFKSIPHMNILTATSENDLRVCFQWALKQNLPVAIRYPKLCCPKELSEFSEEVQVGRGIFISYNKLPLETFSPDNSKKLLLVCTGGMFSECLEAIKMADDCFVDMFILRFVKPFDEAYFIEMAKKYDGIVFVEDGVITGGISEYLNGLLAKNGFTNSIVKGFDDKYYEHGSRKDLLEMAELSPRSILEAIKKC